MSAFVFGGTIGAITGSINFGDYGWLKESIRASAGIFIRSVYNILVDDMMFKWSNWSSEKYIMNVLIRGSTYLAPSG